MLLNHCTKPKTPFMPGFIVEKLTSLYTENNAIYNYH